MFWTLAMYQTLFWTFYRYSFNLHYTLMHSTCQQIWETQQWPQDWRKSVLIPIPKKGNDKEYSSCCTIALISHTSKVMLKILQVHMNCELPNVQEGFKKMQRNQRSNCQHPLDHWKSKRVPEKKTSISALLTMPKPLTVWITINWEKFWKRWEYQTTWLVSWETCMQVRKKQFELDMEQQTGSK